ncbi:Multidrug resistance protein fnx1 [Penicillium rolfsii]|nr:Multidrug resistance protein fnx1 [Penicillium rolfsii]
MSGSHPSEGTPLLRESNNSQSTSYRSVINHANDIETGLSGPEAETDITFPVLTQVSSAQPSLDIEPSLERYPSTASRRKSYVSSHGAHSLSKKESDYASRFIGVSPSQFWGIFSGILLGYVIGFFDSTLMASSYPVITSYFHASNSASWLSTAFLLTSTAFMPLFGRISDALGRKPVYLFSIFMFFVTTAWCGLAQSIGGFIAARAFCGLGAGGVFSMGQVISSDLVRLEYRGVYQSYINLCLGIGSCTGLAFGGLLCDRIGWRGAFLVQLPFIFVYFIVAAMTVPAELGIKLVGSERMTVVQVIRNMDLTGSFFLVSAVTALIMGLNLGGNIFPWSHPLVISSLVAAVILSIVLVRYERNVPLAVLPVELLTQEPRASIIFGNFFGSVSVNTVMFNAPLYFQAVKLATPTDSGLRLLAASIAVTASSVGTGFLITWSKRLKPTIIIGGISMVVGGCLAASMGITTPDTRAMVCVSFNSLGQGFAFPTLMVSILATSHQDEQAITTTTLGLARNLGSVMGVSISSWILQNVLLFGLENNVTGPDKAQIISLVRKSIRAIADLDPLHQQQVVGAYALALRVTFLSAAVWGTIMLVLHSRLRLPRLGSKASEN